MEKMKKSYDETNDNNYKTIDSDYEPNDNDYITIDNDYETNDNDYKTIVSDYEPNDNDLDLPEPVPAQFPHVTDATGDQATPTSLSSHQSSSIRCPGICRS